MKRGLAVLLFAVLIVSCAPRPAAPMPTLTPLFAEKALFTDTPRPTETPMPAPTSLPLVPNFKHIVIVIFENREFGNVIGSPKMPYFNLLASSYTLLTQHYAVTHPSLPNYLALIGGDTFNITSNCENCFVDAPSLPDLIEQSGRTWKTYQEYMPEPCYAGSTLLYVQKHNPFYYFDPIRLDQERCRSHIVPLTQLDVDIAAQELPNFIFITPNACHSAHDCSIEQADNWLNPLLDKLVPALEASGTHLIILTWDEGQGNHSCCGLPEEAGGRIATVLVSPLVKPGFQDDTPYTHYSILKTISEAWGLPYLGHAARVETTLITAPWK